VIWEFDTAQSFKTTNGVRAHGGSLNGAGPAILNGMIFVNTGYTNAMAGNVLLAFGLQDGENKPAQFNARNNDTSSPQSAAALQNSPEPKAAATAP
jgi:hypothetical protein